MLLRDVVRLSLKSLTEKKLRAILTIIGVAIGPLALLMIGSIVAGYGEFIVNSIMGLGQNLIVVTPEPGYSLTREDIQYLRSIPEVVDATPFYTTQGEIIVGGQRRTIYVYGVNPEFITKAISSLRVKEGRIPSSTEHYRALVGYKIAIDEFGERFYSIDDVISITVYKVGPSGKLEIKRLNVQVAGILDRFGGALFLNPDQSIFISIETLERSIGVSSWSGILVLVSDPKEVARVEREIRDVYTNRANVVSFLAIANTISNVVTAVDFVVFAATLSSFAVAVAGVATSMITSVMERTREIGVFKAIGFKDNHIMILIVTEGLIISFIGYVIGGVLGVIGAQVLARSQSLKVGFFNIQAEPSFTSSLIIRSIVMTISVGVLGSLFPAYRAMKIPPAVALKYE